jgi:beta-galactosidase
MPKQSRAPNWFIIVATFLLSIAGGAAQHTFQIGDTQFLLDGKPYQIRCGEIHAPRVPREYWQHRLRMAKAMGLNTVCAYLFWNMHEPHPGQFVWTGQADAVEFCRIAQQEGLWVILRPGPYSCAEWEMGGFPWWLLKREDLQLRTRDPFYLAAARRYLKEVGRVLAPLQIQKGGPILMVQVENEYGFFGTDAQYMGEVRQALVDAGFVVPLFNCNPPEHLKDGYREDLFPVVNFGSKPDASFKKLREVLPRGPLMCGEFYPGWFDTWGQPHHTGNSGQYLKDLEEMLDSGASFSIYMVHGGTTFGLWSGADRPFKPDTSSYDYDAPISEAGWPTEKFFETRALFAKHLMPGESIPEPPPTNAVISFPAIRADECAPVVANLPKPQKDSAPGTMEQYDQGYGCILYRTEVPAGPAGSVEAASVHDLGLVFLDGQRVGFMDRRSGAFKVELPARQKSSVLDILVEAMGRVNFGKEVHDKKGLHGPVKIELSNGQSVQPNSWQIYNLPLDDPMLGRLQYHKRSDAGPAFWRAKLAIKAPGDTFLDVSSWGKGVVWVNGHCLGRFWNIGPTQTMYVPGPWLRPGQNQIVILDLLGPSNPVVAGLSAPVLDRLRPELDFSRR